MYVSMLLPVLLICLLLLVVASPQLQQRRQRGTAQQDFENSFSAASASMTTTRGPPDPLRRSHSYRERHRESEPEPQTHSQRDTHRDTDTDTHRDTHTRPYEVPNRVPWKKYNPRNRIVAFYNMFIGKREHYQDIIEEQLDLMNMTGLMKLLDVVYYVTVGNHFNSMPVILKKRFKANKEGTQSPMFVQLENSLKSVDETLTLSYLYLFCTQHPQSKVLYFHDKGSFHATSKNLVFRHFLDCYVLNPYCSEALDNGFDTCGWRLSTLPNFHYSGNFWWAKCSYVNSLIHPASFILNASFAEKTKSLSQGIFSEGRYFAEAWIGSAPLINPSDCMDHNFDNTFLCCYNFSEVPTKQCPNHIFNLVEPLQDLGRVKYETIRPLIRKQLQRNMYLSPNQTLIIGSSCKAADTLVNGVKFEKAYDEKRSTEEYTYKMDMVDELRKRSALWYGQEPLTLLNNLESLEAAASLPEKAFIVERYVGARYYYEFGHLFNSSSREFQAAENQIAIPTFPISKYKIKSMMMKNNEN